jgi:hypothetical protein
MISPSGASEEFATRARSGAELDARAAALRTLLAAGVPFLVGGAYAFFEFTGIYRDTKDLDLFLRQRDLASAFLPLERAGFRTETVDPVWLAKAYSGEYFVDLIFSSGNGVTVVDDGWFEHGWPGTVMGYPCLLAPPEEMVWSKAFVTERERYDGADVNHLIRACGDRMDWERLLARFGDHWEVLLSHLILYRFAFPGERSRVPAWVVHELWRRTAEQLDAGDWDQQVCRGELISRVQYQHDYQRLGYQRSADRTERAASGRPPHAVRHRKVPPRGCR